MLSNLHGILIIILSATSPSECFKVLWNVPTERCSAFGVHFNLSQYNIVQNTGDKFHGDKVNILYAPGKFPFYDGETPVFGGIPQLAEIGDHVHLFQREVESRIPNNFTGYAILDFEAYQPDIEVSPGIYKNASVAWIKKNHPDWSEKLIDYMAAKSFNQASRNLFEILLEVGKLLRPRGNWGYYGYPYCRNNKHDSPNCTSKQVEANERMSWLFEKSGALYPSIYIFRNGWTAEENGWKVQERLLNAARLKAKANTLILPYFWFKYHDDVNVYLDHIDLWATIGMAWHLKMDGVVIWGGGNDVRSPETCIQLKQYLKETLGPVTRFVSAVSERGRQMVILNPFWNQFPLYFSSRLPIDQVKGQRNFFKTV